MMMVTALEFGGDRKNRSESGGRTIEISRPEQQARQLVI